MPGFDRTGPEGQGSLTGRGMGKCRGKESDNESGVADRRQGKRLGLGNKNRRGQDEAPGRGKGMGAGFGSGRGRGRR